MSLPATKLRYAVIGAGISGLSIARMLNETKDLVTIFEKEDKPGGLVRCERVNDVLYHCVGGHVFNSRKKEVLEWFWNIGQVKEMQMVHSTFHYPRMGGSQFVADSLARGLDIRFNTPVNELNRRGDKWIICGEKFDAIIFCGNVRFLPAMLQSTGISLPGIEALQYHGTTSVLCELEPNPYSWIYMPSEKHESHRIICTGNFAASNSPVGMSTATIEFSEEMSTEKNHEQLQRIPFSPRYITHRYTPCTYPVQDGKTRGVIAAAKATLEPHSIFLLGRFAEWEYYNMDAAMEAAM